MFPTELAIMDTKDTATSASQFELHLKWQWGPLTTRDDFNFLIVNFTLICSNIPEEPANGVYHSLCDSQELIVLIRMSLIEDCC
jgi:hypothetical protein